MDTRCVAAVACCAALLLQALPAPLSAQQKWAVVVGVGDYAAYGDVIGGDLHGPVNDARAIADALVRRWDFPADHVRLLLDGAATRGAIQSALRQWIPAVAAPGDVVIFYFAGHGSQSWDDDGDEADGLDETLAPHDVLPQSTENDISDDDLRLWLGPLHQQQVVVILDSCHSGTATRVVTPYSRPRLLARDLAAVPRAGSPAAPATRGVPGAASAGGGAETAGAELHAPHVIEIAASQPDQAAMDVAWPLPSGDRVEWGGAFTRFLVGQLWSSAAGTTYQTLFAESARELKLAGFSQDPLISAAPEQRGQALFGTAPASGTNPAALMAAPTILAARGDSLTVAVPTGASLPPGTHLLTGGGEFQVVQQAADRAQAVRLPGSPPASAGTIPPGAAHILSRPPLPPPLRLSLAELPAPLRLALRPSLTPMEGISLDLSAGEVPDLLLTGDERRLRLVARDGMLRGEFPANALSSLQEALQWEIAFHALAALANPAQRQPLAVEFGNEQSLLRLGQTVELRVTTPLQGFLTVLDLAPDGTTTLLFPNDADAGTSLGAGTTLTLPSAPMIGDGISFMVEEPTGAGMVRAIVTPDRLPLSPDADGRISPQEVHAALIRLLESGSGGNPGDLPWATAALVYNVQP